MPHCPYCGTKVKEDELYCINCGERLPEDMDNRFPIKKGFNKRWYIPIFLFIILTLSLGIFHFFLQNQTSLAKELYEKGEKNVENGEFITAKKLFEQALTHKSNFPQATISLDFMEAALEIQNNLNKAVTHSGKEDFKKALLLVNKSEGTLKNYNGSGVTPLVNKIGITRNNIKTEQLQWYLQQEPSIDDLKVLLWEAEEIKNENAKKAATTIRNQIIDYTFSKASEQLNKKQFSDAQILVQDGLKYAPDSEKLKSFKTTIDKEKTAFETAQQNRIEQAINTAAEEQELNETSAIELTNVNAENDKQGNLVVTGEVKSVATIPISSILVEYTLSTKKDEAFLSNKVYVFPDTLYPDETGKFEFTHYDTKEKEKSVSVNVTKIKWYTK